VSRHGFGSMASAFNRAATFFVIRGKVCKSGSKSPPASAVAAFRSDNPAADLYAFLSRQACGKHRIGSIEQMMAFVKDQACGRVLLITASAQSSAQSPSGGIDHDQRMIGYDNIGLLAGAGGFFDEAFAVMGAARINTFASPVGQRSGSVAAEQCRQPAGQVAANHIAVF